MLTRYAMFNLFKVSSEIFITMPSDEFQVTLLMIDQYIGSGKGLVLLDKKPLSEPLLAKISDAIWCHLFTMSLVK